MQTFVSGWVTELHAPRLPRRCLRQRGLDDPRPAARSRATGDRPDDVWIADWNGNESVFGDPYVSDALWTNHQRIHQYQGGHNETWAA